MVLVYNKINVENKKGGNDKMTNDYWDQDSNRIEENSGTSEYNTCVRINGSDVPVEAGSPFSETVLSIAENGGLGKFRLFMNGSEFLPDQAPEFIEEGTKIELRPYEVAGIRT